jgi:hypothetical protein
MGDVNSPTEGEGHRKTSLEPELQSGDPGGRTRNNAPRSRVNHAGLIPQRRVYTV